MYFLTLSFKLFRARDLDRALIQNEFFTGGLLSFILCFFTVPLSKSLPILKDLYITPTIATILTIALTIVLTIGFYDECIRPLIEDYVEDHLSIGPSNIQYKTIYKNSIDTDITISKFGLFFEADPKFTITTKEPFSYDRKIELLHETIALTASKHQQHSTIRIDDIVFKTRYASPEAKTYKEDADYSIHSIRLKTSTQKESFFKFERVTTQTTAIVNTLATIRPETLQKIQTQSELDALLRYNKPSTRV